MLFGSERLFEHFDVLLAVRVLVVQGLQFGLQGQQLRLLLRQLLFELVDLETGTHAQTQTQRRTHTRTRTRTHTHTHTHTQFQISRV